MLISQFDRTPARKSTLVTKGSGESMRVKNVARDGEEALDFLFCRGAFAHRSFDYPPKLVLLDLKPPKVDGMEVLKQVKSDPRTKTIPVVILTSSREERDLVSGYHLGTNSYIQKPVDFDQFRETVKSVGLYWLVINQPALVPVPLGHLDGLQDLFSVRRPISPPDPASRAPQANVI